MRSYHAKLAASSLAGLLIITGLVGCAKEAEPIPETIAPSVEPSPEPTVEQTVSPNADVLFTITANVRAADGRTVGISMAAHAPLASTDAKAEKLRETLIGVCGEGNGIRPINEEYLREAGSSLLAVAIESTVPDLTFETPIELLFGSPYYAQGAIGNGISPMPDGVTCFSGFAWAASGSVQAVASFENPEGKPDLKQWTTGMYGFFVKPTSGATIEACKVTITDVGMKQNVSNLPGWNASGAGDGISCKIGYNGE